MPIFLKTKGNSTLAIAICGRCGRKFPRDALRSDPNSPGLMVCEEDVDQFDPWRLTPRAPDQIALEWARPDDTLTPGAWQVPVLPLQAAISTGTGAVIGDGVGDGLGAGVANSTIQQPVQWTASTVFQPGAVVTPGNPVGPAAAGQIIYQFQALLGGQSGATAPAWNQIEGSLVADHNVIWINRGLYLP